MFVQHTDNILDYTNMSGGELQCSYGIIMVVNDVSHTTEMSVVIIKC